MNRPMDKKLAKMAGCLDGILFSELTKSEKRIFEALCNAGFLFVNVEFEDKIVRLTPYAIACK